MLDVKCSPGSVATFCMFPIKLLFNHRGRNVYGRRTEVLAGHTLFLKDKDVLPISHHPCGIIDIKLKIHIGFQGHTHTHTDCTHLKTSTNGKNIQQDKSLYPEVESVGWPLLGGWPCVACYECWLCTVWVSIVTPPPLFAKVNTAPCIPRLPGHRRWAGPRPR